ncbi:MAG: hypothetical protein KGR26_02925 [Cyanobacteria bacterium REEB65]|nr:hypothetical protein [Cyanobacteria bacterium REEB65]
MTTTYYSQSFAYIPLPEPAGPWPATPDATIARIADHVAIAQGQLAEQFRDSPNLQALVGILAGRSQGLEDAFWSIYAARPFPVARGDALSRWGKAVGEPRPTSGPTATDDAAYFGLVKAKILENVSEGMPEAALGLLRDLGAVAVFYGEPGRYAVEIAYVGDLVVSDGDLVAMLTVALPPVGLAIAQAAQSGPFGFDDPSLGFDQGQLSRGVL